MKNLGIILIALCVFSSCTTYQVLSVSSEDARRNNFNELVNVAYNYEIAHSFKGTNLPIQLRVYNDDTRSYLNVDWSSSFVVVEQDTVKFKLFRGDPPRESIKPGEFSDFLVRGIVSNAFNLTNTNAPHVKSFLSVDHGSVPAKSAKFTKNNTPLNFSTHLKLSYFDDFEDSFYGISSFWINEVQAAKVSSEQLVGLPSNQSYVMEEDNSGVGAFFIITILALLPAIMPL